MKMHRFYFIITWVIFYGGAEDSHDCEKIHELKLPEGNVGQTAHFPWLGLLRVHLHEAHAKNYRVAVTGVVLIKHNYALAVSNDVAKIPKHILKDDSKVMFISAVNTPTFVKVKDYLNHPEFEVLTYNTITVIELEITKDFTTKPICWPRLNYNTKGDLYTIGYTDENKILEKEIHKLQYIDKTLCDEFYVRSNLNEDLKPPTRYQCAFSVHNNASCIVENGMAVVSNASGYWMLIGLSVHGPGCAAPNRFIELSTFLPWLTTSVTLSETDVMVDDDGPDLRLIPESALGAGFRRKADARTESKVVPVHALFRKKGSKILYDFPNRWVTDHEVDHREFYGKPDEYEQRHFVPTWIDKYLAKHLKTDNFGPGKAVIKFDSMLEYSEGGCRTATDLIYNDIITIKNHEINDVDTAVYGLSLFDILYQNVTCLKVDIDSYSREKVQVWHEPVFNTYLKNAIQPPETLKKKVYPPIQPPWYNSSEEDTSSEDDDAPTSNKRKVRKRIKDPKFHQYLSPAYLVDEIIERNIPNINIYIRFKYYEKAKMVLTIYGNRKRSLPPTFLMSPDGHSINLLKKIKNHDKLKNEVDDLHRVFWSDEDLGNIITNKTKGVNANTDVEIEFEKPIFDNLNYYSKEKLNNKIFNRGTCKTSNIFFISTVVGGVIVLISILIK